MISNRTWSNVSIGAALGTAGFSIVALMVYPMFWPRQFERVDVPSARAVFDRRWGSLPLAEPLAKADRRLTSAPETKPWGPVAGLLQPPLGEERVPPPAIAGGPVEQALERRHEDAASEHAVREYHREAARRGLEEPRELCARHGMRRHYFHRRHHLLWRCVGRGR